MRTHTQLIVVALFVAYFATSAYSQTVVPGSEEFGLTERELIQAVEKVESAIAQCMKAQGFEYVPVDYRTVRRGMSAMMTLPGMDEEEFIEAHGYGLATLYTGQAPQLVQGYSPARVGLGDRNIQIFKNLSPADQVAYNRALFGQNTDASFAVSLDAENFSLCGGCTLKAVEQVFKPEQLKATYMNPKDALIAKDPRMRDALRKFADAMRKAGFAYSHPDDIETDIRAKLHAITEGGTIPIDKLSAEQKAALKKLQEDERRLAKLELKLSEDLIDDVEAAIEREMFARGGK
jgi:hypothetical protein